MFSNKMIFSLASLVFLLAFVSLLVPPTVDAALTWTRTQSDIEWAKGVNLATAVNLPRAQGATGVTYSLLPAPPTGVLFLTDLPTPQFVFGPRVGMATTAYTLTASASGETAITQTFNITVHSPTKFSSQVTPHRPVGTVGQSFSMVLPAATQEDGDTTTYTLSGDIPDGLTFTAASQTLAGTPTEATAGVELTYTAVDGGSATGDGDSSATFTLVVNSAPPRRLPRRVFR